MFSLSVESTDPIRFVTMSGPHRSSCHYKFGAGVVDSDRSKEEESILVSYFRWHFIDSDDLSDDEEREAGDEAGVAVKFTGWGEDEETVPELKFLCRSQASSRNSPPPRSQSSHPHHQEALVNAVAGPSREREDKQPAAPAKATMKNTSVAASTSSAKAKRAVSSSQAHSQSAPTPSQSSQALENAVAGPSRRAVEIQQQPSLASTPASNAPTASRSPSYGGGFEQHNDDDFAHAQSATPFLPLHPPSRQSSSADLDPYQSQQYPEESRFKIEEGQTGLQRSEAEVGAVGSKGEGRSSTLRAALQGLPVPSVSNASASRNPPPDHRVAGPSQQPGRSTATAHAPSHPQQRRPTPVHSAGALSAPNPSQPRKRTSADPPPASPAPLPAQAEIEELVLSSSDDDEDNCGNDYGGVDALFDDDDDLAVFEQESRLAKAKREFELARKVAQVEEEEAKLVELKRRQKRKSGGGDREGGQKKKVKRGVKEEEGERTGGKKAAERGKGRANA